MRGFKASILIIVLTAATCAVLVGIIRLKNNDVYAMNSELRQKDIFYEGEGTFPGNINYEYADGEGIYHIKYNDRSSISVYDIYSGKSRILITPIKPGNYIHAFSKYENYIVWEEDQRPVDDSENEGNIHSWDIYISEDGKALKIDEGKPKSIDINAGISLYPEKICMTGDYVVYRAYGAIPGTSEEGIVIKLYDIKRNKSKVIFSLMDIDNTEVSNPYIYNNRIVWSTAGSYPDVTGENEKYGLYIYDIKTESYIMPEGGHGLVNPVIWEDYVVCRNMDSKYGEILLFNIKDGLKDSIVCSDGLEASDSGVLDYSIGHGYITWNLGQTDSIWVYDISKKKVTQLKTADRANNNLLNAKIFGSMLLYTDHVFNDRDGSTVSEVGRYIALESL